jgi:hypothetical protein
VHGDSVVAATISFVAVFASREASSQQVTSSLNVLVNGLTW